MCIWSAGRKTTRIYGFSERNRSQPGEDSGNSGHETPSKAPRCPKIDRVSCGTQPIHFPTWGKGTSPISVNEKIVGLQVVRRSSDGLRRVEKATINLSSPGSTK